MKMKHCRPRCSAITSKGARCKMTAARDQRTLCRYHDPELAPETHRRNKQARDRYWQRWREAKAASATAASYAVASTSAA